VNRYPIKKLGKVFGSTLLSIFIARLGAVQTTFAADTSTISPNFLATITNQYWGNPGAMDRQTVIDRTFIPYTGESHP